MNLKIKYFYAFLRKQHCLLRFRRNKKHANRLDHNPKTLHHYFCDIDSDSWILQSFNWEDTLEGGIFWYNKNILWNKHCKWLDLLIKKKKENSLWI